MDKPEKLDKAAALKWFKAHKEKEIEIKWRGEMLRLRGRCTGVQTLDACSTEYEESQLVGLHEDIQIGFSFHDSTLGVQISVYAPEAGQTRARQPAAFVPMSIPYDRLLLSTPQPGKETGGDAAGGQEGEPEFSPYELLH